MRYYQRHLVYDFVTLIMQIQHMKKVRAIFSKITSCVQVTLGDQIINTSCMYTLMHALYSDEG